jgi:hypothetical protein
MASKAEVRNYIKSNFRYEDTDDLDFMKLLIELDDDRSQLTFVSILDNGIMINSIFATKDDITPAQALNLGQSQVLGIKQVDNFYAVTSYVPTADVDASEINTGILFCAIQADNMEQEVGGDRF